MNKPNALEFFRGKYRYNCAQAVLKAYAPMTGIGEACVERFAQYGSGRAPGGQCGALYAAKALVADPDTKQEVERQFLAIAEMTTCRDIRRGRRISCEQCVQAASDAVFVQVHQKNLLQPPSDCPC